MVVPEIICLKRERAARNALLGSLHGLDKLEFLICHHKLGLDTLSLKRNEDEKKLNISGIILWLFSAKGLPKCRASHTALF